MPPLTDPLTLGQKLVAVLESGRRTATYKLAVLMALLDLAVESVPDDADAAGAALGARPTRSRHGPGDLAPAWRAR